jgi:hypothetical protein
MRWKSRVSIVSFLLEIMEGFTMFKDTYAAIPFGKQLMIIHNGEQLKVCRTEASARKFIDAHKKGKSLGKLPTN